MRVRFLSWWDGWVELGLSQRNHSTQEGEKEARVRTSTRAKGPGASSARDMHACATFVTRALVHAYGGQRATAPWLFLLRPIARTYTHTRANACAQTCADVYKVPSC